MFHFSTIYGILFTKGKWKISVEFFTFHPFRVHEIISEVIHLQYSEHAEEYDQDQERLLLYLGLPTGNLLSLNDLDGSDLSESILISDEQHDEEEDEEEDEPPQSLELTEDDNQAIFRLMELGFDQSECTGAYLGSGRNENLAANRLLGGGFYT